MRILWVVQRFGSEVLGGAESESRETVRRLARRGHQVEVLTSCAVDYVTWANHRPAGTSEEDGVLVHRLPVATQRRPEFFALDARMRRGERLSGADQRTWLNAQGPLLTDLPAWLRREAPRFDVAVFMTYLYWPTVIGLPIVAALLPTVLVPTAHDEPALRQPLFDTLFHHADRLYYNAPEEAELLARRLGRPRPGDVIGTGIESAAITGDATGFRAASGLGDRPYLLYVGRIDEHKGAGALHRWFLALKRRRPGPLALAFVGSGALELAGHPDVISTGFVADDVRNAAMRGALALVQPSPNESFSIVMAEAWASGTPAIVSRRSPVLTGQATRSGGAIPVEGYAEFEAAVDLLREQPALRSALVEAGRRYLHDNYEWDVVLDRVEACLTSARVHHEARITLSSR